ncbi:uncharacterized protein GO595_003989 [Histomonas meleagridis]|uniref:uncharacterized protein n=1 Tax=Histomonas meleagridis TaxID=135588 RepID=UPI00355A1F8F|nr:hypothetical protein GO595_003989 [Histomonas meleagridis]
MVNVDESMKILANYIKSSSIGSLIIRGTSPTVYGRHLYPVLDELSNVSTLKHLDVTGQNILDRGLGYLYNLIIHGLEELYFDGSGSSFESLNQFITEMMQTDITQTQWPESDVKNIISNSNPSQIKEIENDLNKLKTSFSKQYSSTTTDSFGSQASNNTPSTAMPRRRHRLTYKRRRKGTLKKSMPLLPVTRRSILVKMQCEADFAYREEPIASYFYECLGVDAVTEMRTDVLLNTFYKIYG